MLLKRSIVLAAGVLLFIAAFLIYFEVSNMQMEARFRAERKKFNVDGVNLTAAPDASSPAPPPSSPTPDSAPDTNAAPAPAATDSTSTPAPAPDANSAPATPDTNSAPVSPDTNSAPMTPAPSTMNEPRGNSSPFQPASYRPADGAGIPFADLVMGQVTNPAPSVPTPAANPATDAASAPTAAPVTNFAPARVVEPALSDAKGATVLIQKTTPAPPALPATGESSVIVLLYHQFKPAGIPIPAKFQWTLNQDVFESEMKYIHDNGYHVVPLSDLIRFLKHEITLPPGSVVITIDDGYKSAIVYAAPILKKYGFPWTFFIYPDFITVNEGSGAASWKDLLELQKEGVDIESHSMTHPQLTRHRQLIKGVWHNLSPEEYDAWLTNETAGARTLLEQKLGRPIPYFAYPYGDYNSQVKAKAIAAGYKAILTVAGNPVHSTTDPFSIGRYTITQSEVKNFASDLHQGALALSKTEPDPGATISDPRPVITAVLDPMGEGKIDPQSIKTTVYDFDVRHDFDPQTNTVRLYLPRDLIQPLVQVTIHVKDATTGRLMVANWRFNYAAEASATTSIHPPIAPATNAPPASNSQTTAPAPTNARAATEAEPMEKKAAGTPLDAHPVATQPTTD